jgi:hypothetical protein
VPYADRHPPGEQPVQHGRVHRRRPDIPEWNRQHADPHPQTGRPGERRGASRDRAAPEAVLPQPQFIESRTVRRDGDVSQLFRWHLRQAHHA